MKKLTLWTLTAFMLLSFIPTQLKAVTEPSTFTMAAVITVESAEANILLVRLNEIKAMDMAKLNSTEKKQLRKEVRSIKSELKALNGGIYLSVGAIIIIILLLILLLT